MMKITGCIQIVFLCLLSLVSINTFASDGAYKIIKGEVTVTPARCPYGCIGQTLGLSGEVHIDIDNGVISFPKSDVATSPKSGFELPLHPSQDSGGTRRQIRFEVLGADIVVSGVIDNRAFDGPLYTYDFRATNHDLELANTYYSIRPDFRKCASPMCGGFWVKALNQKVTQCLDGSENDECYVARLENDESGYSKTIQGAGFFTDTPFVIVGKQRRSEDELFNGLAVLEVKSLYKAIGSDFTHSDFYGAKKLPLYCLLAPCFNGELDLLNDTFQRNISDIAFNIDGADEYDVMRAERLFWSGELLIANGDIQIVWDGAIGVRYAVSQAYLPVDALFLEK